MDGQIANTESPISTYTLLMLDLTQQRIIKYSPQKGGENFSLIQTIIYMITIYQTKICYNLVGMIIVNVAKKMDEFATHLNPDQTIFEMFPAN
ncbi:hypothetical protein G9A89_012287 [Geosiphon pyriformis]|nr:hypothetical protein G9A89_012287 [Geosiphon pyriformis]